MRFDTPRDRAIPLVDIHSYVERKPVPDARDFEQLRPVREIGQTSIHLYEICFRRSRVYKNESALAAVPVFEEILLKSESDFGRLTGQAGGGLFRAVALQRSLVVNEKVDYFRRGKTHLSDPVR